LGVHAVQVALFCDLHGHSRKQDIFLYGCQKRQKDFSPVLPGWPVPGSMGGLPSMSARLQEKLLPLLLQFNAPDLFSYHSCAFRVQKAKGGTGRVVGFKELGLVNRCCTHTIPRTPTSYILLLHSPLPVLTRR
jgi:cytosolic carboxypeptidase protein 2/3